MSIGERIIKAIEARRDRRRRGSPGAYGDFYSAGGDALLYDVHVNTGSLVIDAGGYEGSWTAKMLATYGCRSMVFEPFPLYAEKCKSLYAKNDMVEVRATALGGTGRTASFSFGADGTSEYLDGDLAAVAEVQVEDVVTVFESLSDQTVSCLKLNIEGGEYEVLERLLAANKVSVCQSLLIQFHAQPEGWESRMHSIKQRLESTHECEWCYPMIWEKWVIKGDV